MTSEARALPLILLLNAVLGLALAQQFAELRHDGELHAAAIRSYERLQAPATP